MQMHPSLKPFAAWATDLIDRYRFNPFVRTATLVGLLQILVALISILVFAWGIQAAEEETVLRISSKVEQALASTTTATSTGSLQDISEVLREQAYASAFAAVLALNALFGFIIARFALGPARNSLQFQKRFIGNVAHEIRTPLAIIKTNTEVGLFDPHLPEHVRQTYTDTVVELDRISETINNLLSFNTLTRPRRMITEPVDVGAIALNVINRHEALADSRGVALLADISERQMVNGNATALEQVITNLVKNAVNYTPKDQGGSVTVTVGEADEINRVSLTVKDTGIGIEQKDLLHVFEPFYRGDTSRARDIGTGTSGLGLAIVNEIVRLHKGAISIRSTPGRGTMIRITLPSADKRFLEDEDSDINEVSVDFR